MSNPYNQHGMNPIARAAHRSASATAIRMSHQATAQHMRMSRMAMAQATKFARQSAARARATKPPRLRPLSAPSKRARQKTEFEARLTGLRNELRGAVDRRFGYSRLLDQQNGVALFLESNWKGRDEVARCVFRCNTALPESRRHVVAFLLTAEGLEPVDFAIEPMAEAALRGRLFVFAATVAFSQGEAYAVRPALSSQEEGGEPGLWSFPTAGLYQRRLFLVGNGWVGGFAARELQGNIVVRPTAWSEKVNAWAWVGRSSKRVGPDLQFFAEDLLRAGPEGCLKFSLPGVSPDAQSSVLSCNRVDDLGDPLGVYKATAGQTFGIREVDGRLHFFGVPNLRDSMGRLLFARRAVIADDGTPVVRVRHQRDGEAVVIELPANHREKDGSYWFVRPTNRVETRSRQPIVWFGLSE